MSTHAKRKRTIDEILKVLDRLGIKPDGYRLLGPYETPKPRRDKKWQRVRKIRFRF